MPTAEPLAHSPYPLTLTLALTLTLTPIPIFTFALTPTPTPTLFLAQVAPPFTEVLAGSGVEFVQGTVAGLDAESRMVRVTTGGGEGGGEAAERLLPYDACVLALGARATGYARVPGAEAHSRQFYTLDDALALRKELQALRLKRKGGLLRVAVVGNGYIGTELSANLASWLGPQSLSLTLVGSGDEVLTLTRTRTLALTLTPTLSLALALTLTLTPTPTPTLALTRHRRAV